MGRRTPAPRRAGHGDLWQGSHLGDRGSPHHGLPAWDTSRRQQPGLRILRLQHALEKTGHAHQPGDRQVLQGNSGQVASDLTLLFCSLDCLARAWLPAALRSQLSLLKIPIQLSAGTCLFFTFPAASGSGRHRTAHLNEARRSGRRVFLFSLAFSQRVPCEGSDLPFKGVS